MKVAHSAFCIVLHILEIMLNVFCLCLDLSYITYTNPNFQIKTCSGEHNTGVKFPTKDISFFLCLLLLLIILDYNHNSSFYIIAIVYYYLIINSYNNNLA